MTAAVALCFLAPHFTYLFVALSLHFAQHWRMQLDFAAAAAAATAALLQCSLWQTFRLADLLLLRITIITRHRLALRSN